jgi:hypothetical protein
MDARARPPPRRTHRGGGGDECSGYPSPKGAGDHAPALLHNNAIHAAPPPHPLCEQCSPASTSIQPPCCPPPLPSSPSPITLHCSISAMHVGMRCPPGTLLHSCVPPSPPPPPPPRGGGAMSTPRSMPRGVPRASRNGGRRCHPNLAEAASPGGRPPARRANGELRRRVKLRIIFMYFMYVLCAAERVTEARARIRTREAHRECASATPSLPNYVCLPSAHVLALRALGCSGCSTLARTPPSCSLADIHHE